MIDEEGSKTGNPEPSEPGTVEPLNQEPPWAQAFDATISVSISAGVRKPSVLRGRSFNSRAIRFRTACECAEKSVPRGKYWRSKPFVFSFEPRCHGLCG